MQDLALTTYAIDDSAPSSFYGIFGKRIFDITLAIIIFPALLPVILAMWCVVRQDGGPGFFGHTRVGRNGKPFKCWKVRSMVADAESRLEAHLKDCPNAAAEWERDHKLSNDPRINRLGHFLRMTSLDELPQIWNVMRGDMSFVGPRPIVTKELVKYGDSVAAYLTQKPGITGLWQVSGRNDVSYDERVEMDVAYLAERSFLNDIVILAKTGSAVLHRTGR